MRTLLYFGGIILIGLGLVLILSATLIGVAPGIACLISGFFLLVYARLLENQEKMQRQINEIARRLNIGEIESEDKVDFDVEKETERFLKKGKR